MTLDETMASLYQELAARSPKQVIRSAAEKFSKAQLACQSIDPDVVGARGAVKYAISLADAARSELLHALAMGRSDRDASADEASESPGAASSTRLCADEHRFVDASGAMLPRPSDPEPTEKQRGWPSTPCEQSHPFAPPGPHHHV